MSADERDGMFGIAGAESWVRVRVSALAAKNARIEWLEGLLREAIENCETCRGSVDCARCKTFAAVLEAK